MDKYTYNLKADKIQRLVRQEDYVTAVKIADTMDWKQERNVRLLTSAAEAYEKTGQYQTAIDLLLSACERATVRKRILYKLTELSIRNDSIEDAETFYKTYLEEASDENNRYILRYMIAEAKGESLDKKINILEAYRKHEFEEKWACRLAELYQESGREKECVALCDEIILWFGVGKYVDRAMELKEMYQPLTESQKAHRENRAYYEEKVREVAKEMEEALERTPEENEEASEDPFENLAAAPSGSKEQPVKDEEKPADEAAEKESAPESPAESAAAEEEMPLPEIAISEEVAAAFDFNETPEGKEGSVEEPAEECTEETEAEPTETENGNAPEDMFEEDPEEEPKDPDQTKRLNLYDSLRSPKQQEAEELAKTQEVILPSQLRETPEVEHVVPGTAEEVPEETPEAPAAEEEPGVPADGEPEEVSGEQTQAEENEDAPSAEAEAEAETETLSGREESLEESPEEPLPLEKDANVLPVISYEETEKAVWEDQNRRMEEREPSESHEMEHCIFVSAANSAEGVNKAVEVLGEHYRKANRELSAIAKITGEKLNRRGLIRSLPQLKKKDLIIDEAGKLDDAIIGEMLEVMEYLEPGKVFVLLETPAETEKLRQRVRSQIIEAEKTHGASAAKPEENAKTETKPEQEAPASEASDSGREEEKAENRPAGKEGVKRISFANLSENQVLSEKDFLRYAEYFARELECSIDPSGMQALEDECRLIRKEGGLLTVGEAEAVIEDAAEHAEKHTIKRLFAAKYDKEGYLILRKRNFA